MLLLLILLLLLLLVLTCAEPVVLAPSCPACCCVPVCLHCCLSISQQLGRHHQHQQVLLPRNTIRQHQLTLCCDTQTHREGRAGGQVCVQGGEWRGRGNTPK